MQTESTFAANSQCSHPENVSAVSLHAANDTDEAFLADVFISTRWDEFSRTGWEPQRIEAFLRQQFQFQHTYYHEHYPHACFDVVLAGAEPVGRLYHAWRPPQIGDEVRIIDIALLPAWRGKGIGTQLLHALIADAVREQLPVSLNVETDNPAQALYRRLGFVKQSGGSGVYDLMRRECAPFDAPAVSLAALRGNANVVAM
ncbi:GNAT family N-acetyltransferase [Paraburkholderia sp. ZP32-5]|uniref:GNAT family N-acetyltransferase n=1 Tax=Paraburkholderia sp. ZP32-5 TaxID=2883245 RepID=UPI001F34D0DB|nr:GNAT family N-acetyltransferase [Paraburkholderia sp. ZP32-5]